MFVGRQHLQQPEKHPTNHKQRWMRRGSKSLCAAMECCYKAWTTTVGKYMHIHCSCRKNCLKRKMRSSFVWTSLAGSHNRCLIRTLYFPQVWPLLLSFCCRGYQSSVTLVRPHSFCGEKKFHQMYEHTDSSWKHYQYQPFHSKSCFVSLPLWTSNAVLFFLLQILAIPEKNGREVARAPASCRHEAISLSNACQGSHWQMWGTAAS